MNKVVVSAILMSIAVTYPLVQLMLFDHTLEYSFILSILLGYLSLKIYNPCKEDQ